VHAADALAKMRGVNTPSIWILGRGAVGARMHSVLPSPASPRYPGEQFPHVLVTVPHGCLKIVAHSASVASRHVMELTIEDATSRT
jgi:hypothetical protein